LSLGRKKVEVIAGDICAIVGLKVLKLVILLLILKIEGLASIAIDEPTMSMLFTINDFLLQR
jgi:GTP-binding protein